MVAASTQIFRLISAEHYLDAIALSKDIPPDESTSPRLKHNLAVAHYKIGQPGRARRLLESVLSGQTASATSHYLLGLIRQEQGDEKRAVDAFTRALTIDPLLGRAYFSRGNCFFRMGDKHRAARDLLRARELEPNFVWTHYNLGVVYASLEKWHKAGEAFSTCARLDSLNAQDYHALLVEIGKAQVLREMYFQGHRIKNMVGIVSSQLRQFVKETSSSLTAGQKDESEDLLARHEKLLADLTDYLSAMRTDSPDYDLADVHTLIDSALMAAGPALAHLSVEKSYDNSIPELVCDAAALKESFLNVILNAAEATAGGGKLAVSTRLAAQHRLEVVFSDNGVGIAREHLHRAFECGFTTKPLGSGMGLFQFKRAVEAQDGHAEIESTPGGGTTVRAVLGMGPRSQAGLGTLSIRSPLREELSLLVLEEEALS